MSNGLKVKKRNGHVEQIDLDKMHVMVDEACKNLPEFLHHKLKYNLVFNFMMELLHQKSRRF